MSTGMIIKKRSKNSHLKVLEKRKPVLKEKIKNLVWQKRKRNKNKGTGIMFKRISSLLIFLILLTGCAGIKPNLGIENGQLSQCPTTPNCVSSMTTDKEYYIDPIVTSGNPLEVKQQILNILNEFKNTTIVVSENNYIRAEFSSTYFHFIDDVEFYFPETKSEEMIIHVRSASRVGQSDFGVNRKRIEQIRAKFN